MQDTNSRLKNYCAQTNIDYIDNNNIKKEHLGNKKLHLNKRGNTVFANNLLKYLRSSLWGVDYLNCLKTVLESQNEYKSKSLDSSPDDPPFSSLKSVRRKNLSRIIFALLNINSLRNRFDTLVHQIKGNDDVFVISETKLDESFPEGQFKIPEFATPFRRDRNKFGGGIMVFVREDIPSKLISKETLDIEGIFIELNFRKKKWLLSCSYNPNKNTITDHLEILRRNLDLYSAHYENLIIIGDLNTDINQSCIKSFCESYTLPSLIKEPTCHKNPQNPPCIDLTLTNTPYSFQNSWAIETGLSDFHKMAVTVSKTTYQKLKPRITNYRDYKNFCNDTFRQKLLEKLATENINTNCSGLEKFLQICVNTLNNLAPCKEKILTRK